MIYKKNKTYIKKVVSGCGISFQKFDSTTHKPVFIQRGHGITHKIYHAGPTKSLSGLAESGASVIPQTPAAKKKQKMAILEELSKSFSQVSH